MLNPSFGNFSGFSQISKGYRKFSRGPRSSEPLNVKKWQLNLFLTARRNETKSLWALWLNEDGSKHWYNDGEKMDDEEICSIT